jgi:predicted nucleotidyltransferase
MKRIIFCMCMVSVPNKIKSQFTENVGLYVCKIILDRGSTVTIYGLNVTNIGLPNMMVNFGGGAVQSTFEIRKNCHQLLMNAI